MYPSNIYHFKYERYFESTNIDFVDIDNSIGDQYLIVTEIGGRKSVLYLDDNDFDAGEGIDFSHEGFDINGTGTIELLVFTASAFYADLTITLYDGATRLVRIVYDESEFDFDYNNGGGLTEIYNGTVAGWYIVRIDIDINAGINGQFSCYIKDTDYTTLGSVENIEFENNATTVDKIRFDTLTNNGSGYYALDLIGITAEGGYIAGSIQYAETDISDKMENTRIHDGIIPYKKFLTFDCHPKYETYFNEGDFIEMWDVNGVFCFTGYIKIKSRDRNGIYKFSCPSMTNEVFERTYNKSFSLNKTSEKLQDIIDNKLEFCYRESSITATTIDWSYEYERACIYMFNLTRYLERQVIYIEPDGKVWSKNYNALAATGKSWTLYDGNQSVLLIDIPGLKDAIPGYLFGNTGTTSVSIRYKGNTTIIRPAIPVETFKRKRLHEFRDPKIQASTEANQLGDNLYSLFSIDTIFLGLLIKDQGWLQPGKTIQIQNTGQIIIIQNDFLIVKFVYDPKNDVYINMILSDNIITPDEFKSDLDTSGQQIHTGLLQSFENQANIGIGQKGWKNCLLEGAFNFAHIKMYQGAYKSIDGNNPIFSFGIPLDYIIGTHNLVITKIKVGLDKADSDDYISNIFVRAYSDYATPSTPLTDPTNYNSAQLITWDFSDLIVGGVYEKINIEIECVTTGAEALWISFVKVEYYYT